MTIHQLQVFVTIAEHRSIRLAAEQLVVTQPAVSASLASLERAVGAQLVERAGRGIELTEAGEILEGYSRRLLGLLDEAISATKLAATPAAVPVRVAATTASADHMLMPQMAKVRHHRPGLEFILEVGNRAKVWQLLADRSVDLAVSAMAPATGTFESLAVRANEFVIVAKPGAVVQSRLGEVTWLVREEGSSSRAATEEVIALLAITPPTLVIGSNAAIQRSVESGLGVALLPAEMIGDAVRARALAIVHAGVTPLRKPWHLMARTGEPLSDTARLFVEDLVAIGGEFELTAAGRNRTGGG